MLQKSDIATYNEAGHAAASEHNQLLIKYLVESQTLVVEWEGKFTSHEVRAGYEKVMEVAKRHKPKKWLLDLHKRRAIRREDQRWVFSHIFPQVLHMLDDTTFIALILPVRIYHGLVNVLQGDELIQGDNLMIINHFLYQEEGFRWLNSL